MTHDPEANCCMPPIPATFDGILDELRASTTTITTQDGNCIITDPELGFSISRRTREEAEAEVRRLKGMGRLAA